METNLPLLKAAPTRWLWHWLQLLLSPRLGLKWLSEREQAGWFFPLLLISASSVLQALVTLATAQPQPDPIVWVLSVVLRLALIWVSWLLLSGLLRSYFILAGIRCPANQPRILLAWTMVPFLLRDLVRIGYTLITSQPILCPGLSGLFCQAEAGPALFLGQFLAQFDLYLCWAVFLAWLGLHQMLAVTKVQALLGLGGSLFLVGLLRAGLGTLVILTNLPTAQLLL